MFPGIQRGYTIVEVLIFMAISSAMFVFVVITFAGRQEDIRFRQSLNDFEAQMRDLMNDVSTGFLPNADFECQVLADGSFDFSGGMGEQGANADCVNLGKAVVINDTSDNFAAMSLVGSNQALSRASDYEALGLQPVTDSGSGDNVFTTTTLTGGAEVYKVAFRDAPAIEFGAIGFLPALATTAGGSDGQNVVVAGFRRVQLAGSPAAATINGDSSTNLRLALANQELIICLRSVYDAERKASLTLGGSVASTVLDIDTYDKAVCD